MTSKIKEMTFFEQLNYKHIDVSTFSSSVLISNIQINENIFIEEARILLSNPDEIKIDFKQASIHIENILAKKSTEFLTSLFNDYQPVKDLFKKPLVSCVLMDIPVLQFSGQLTFRVVPKTGKYFVQGKIQSKQLFSLSFSQEISDNPFSNTPNKLLTTYLTYPKTNLNKLQFGVIHMTAKNNGIVERYQSYINTLVPKQASSQAISSTTTFLQDNIISIDILPSEIGQFTKLFFT